jgi:hypothetical protein
MELQAGFRTARTPPAEFYQQYLTGHRAGFFISFLWQA